jgi:Uma2 family endonuclease
MYDLKSEDQGEPGLPDEYHYLQPQLLGATLRLTNYAAERVFSVGDMNLYYDVNHPSWYKRPDWFLVLGVPRLYDNRDTRLSYVVWQEGVNPFLGVELLSPGTEKEDLGRKSLADSPPTKWEVYERILRVP